jgi:hypothetical protein
VQVTCIPDEVDLVMEKLRPEGLYLVVEDVYDKETGLSIIEKLFKHRRLY